MASRVLCRGCQCPGPLHEFFMEAYKIMRVGIKRAGGSSSSCAHISIKREACAGARDFACMAALSPCQLRKIEKSCGGMPPQTVAADECEMLGSVCGQCDYSGYVLPGAKDTLAHYESVTPMQLSLFEEA